MEKLKLYFPWIFRGLVLLILLLLVAAWNSARSARMELAKQLELIQIEKAGLLAERDASKKQLTDREKELLDHDGAMRAEVERMQKALDEKPKVIEIVKWKTKEVPVEVPGESRPCPQPGTDGKPAPKIILVEGDTGHAEVSEITYETKANNHVIIGSATCFRDTPTPMKLWSSVIEAPVSIALQTPEPEPYRWGVGIYGGLGPNGKLALGPVLAFPPFHALWLQWEGSLGTGITIEGRAQPYGQMVARWR